MAHVGYTKTLEYKYHKPRWVRFLLFGSVRRCYPRVSRKPTQPVPRRHACLLPSVNSVRIAYSSVHPKLSISPTQSIFLSDYSNRCSTDSDTVTSPWRQGRRLQHIGIFHTVIKIFNNLPHNIESLSNCINKFKYAFKKLLRVGYALLWRY
jgi:hypothetical protein